MNENDTESPKADRFDFASIETLPFLPDIFHPDQGDEIPDGLIGATIISIGNIPVPFAVEGGGLVIDYRRPGKRPIRRLVLGFNELGMWVEHHSRLRAPSTTDSSQE